ncbi:DUF4915 domain-containing protein [Jatrophihabitans sp. DSM 45814]
MASALLASSPATEGGGGGVYLVGPDGAELLDAVPTSGMCASPDGSRLGRLAWAPQDNVRSELFITDSTGLLLYRRLDDVSEPHSMLWDGDEIIVVSTHTDSVLWLDETGREIRRWSPAALGGRGDNWHLNGLCRMGERVLVSCFGRFDRHRGWSAPGARDGAGIVFDPVTSEVVLSGLSAPHDPVWLGDGWLVCNSMTRELWSLDPAGDVRAQVDLGGWTRGIEVDDEFIYVGVGVHRDTDPAVRARIAVLDRHTLMELNAFELPGREVFALARVSEDVVDGLRVGARTGALEATGSPQVRMDEPLAAADCAVRLRIVEGLDEDAMWGLGPRRVTVRVTNLSSVSLSGLGPYPVRIGARWYSENGDSVDGERGFLPAPLRPGASADVELTVTSPMTGPAVLRLGVVQEFVRWFDEVSPAATVAVKVDGATV